MGAWDGTGFVSALCWLGAARAGAEQNKQEAAVLLWLRAPLPALETIDHLTGKAFPAWVYFTLQSSSSLGCKQLPKQ